jgi:uncharacterized cofD-like protein
MHSGGISHSKAVCVGGGTGMPVSIKALLTAGIYTDAVVAMADDGGSSGMLRGHTGLVPPGDLRKCLTALAGDPNSVWTRAFKQRFEYAHNHTLGNLMLTALQESCGSLPQAITLCEQLLQTRGHAYPSTLESVRLSGVTLDGVALQGQSTICKSKTALAHVCLEPQSPRAYEPALTALREADLIVLGPGSLFTSIIPNLLVQGVLDAIDSARARAHGAKTVFICSLADAQGETWGLSAAELVEMLLAHGMRGRLDYVIAHKPASPDRRTQTGNVTGLFKAIDADTFASAQKPEPLVPTIRPVVLTSDDEARIRAAAVKLITRDLADPTRPTWHNREALKNALLDVQ